jgi:hypothetical protein
VHEKVLEAGASALVPVAPKTPSTSCHATTRKWAYAEHALQYDHEMTNSQLRSSTSERT